MSLITIVGSVGKGGKNIKSDVASVQARLCFLGFHWTPAVVSDLFIQTVMLFQSIKNGSMTVNGDGRVDPGGNTLEWLNSARAPRWQTLSINGAGFRNDEAADKNDQHDYGTSWLDETIFDAGEDYQAAWTRSRPTAALIAINDASLPRGGPTPAHKGHETGLGADLRLPKYGGGSGGITTADKLYDRDTMRAQLQAFWEQPLTSVVLLSDSVLAAEGLCKVYPGHENHVHLEIKPPKLT